MTSVKWLYIIYIFWGEWPSRFRHCNQNQNIPSSNPIRSLAGLRDPTSLQGSQWTLCQKCKKTVINILGVNSVANNGCSSAITDRLRTSVDKKTWKLQKWPTTFHTHTQKERILKLSNLKDLFFLIFYSTPLKLLLEFRYTRNVHSPYLCMNVELDWIADSWKQFLFFLHKTLHDYSLWNLRINLTNGLGHML